MKIRRTAFAVLALSAAAPAYAAPSYTVAKTVALGTPDRWDYVVFDPRSGRVYVAHGDQLAVVDGRSGENLGHVDGINGGTHGVAISNATGQGFTDDGRNGTAVAFDLKTFKIVKQIPADQDADAMVLDPVTGHVLVIEGDPGAITVIDPKADSAVATIKVGEKLEYAVGDGKGAIYVAGEEKGDLVKIDARTNTVVSRWPAAGCTSPHGLAMDPDGRRVFMGCANAVMMVMDADDGRVVAKLPIGRGNDAVAWDGNRKRAFSSNGVDGTISVYQQNGNDRYAALEPIRTMVSGRTMAVDPASGRLFVAAAETDPNPAGGRPRTRPGTLRLLMLDPVE